MLVIIIGKIKEKKLRKIINKLRKYSQIQNLIN